jgi:phytoene dehydrogenase-like protein
MDAAVIGAGPEGLVAAIVLARAGLSVVVVEKSAAAGGRATTTEFHPGFHASPFCDELPAIPRRLFRVLDLARQGVVLAPAPASACISGDGTSLLFADEARAARAAPSAARAGSLALIKDVAAARNAIAQRAFQLTPMQDGDFHFFKTVPRPEPWPRGDWMDMSLAEYLGGRISDPLLRLHFAADAVAGRAVSPFLAGTAIHLVGPGVGRSGQPAGGLGTLGLALSRLAERAGVTLRLEAEVTAIHLEEGRAVGLAVRGDEEELKARTVISALDLKRTLLNLAPWGALPDETSRRIAQFRLRGQTARILFALDAPPELAFAHEAADAAMGPIHVAESLEALSLAHESWRAGVIPEAPLVTLRVPSLLDPRLAPFGKAAMTATISAVPEKLFDGVWTEAKRERLAALALAAAERVSPGIGNRVLALRIVLARDIEEELGLTAGDLDGGELAPDQALDLRPFGGSEWIDGRTPIANLYLAGPSAGPSPILLGASGERAARALLSDLKLGRLR